MNKAGRLLVATSTLFAISALTPALAAVDVAKAEELVLVNKCAKCHEPAKTKTAPSYKKTAAKYKGRADAEAMVIKNITTGPTVKDSDGNEEEHYIIKTKDAAQLKNLAQWILSH
jgi:cytochrome c